MLALAGWLMVGPKMQMHIVVQSVEHFWKRSVDALFVDFSCFPRWFSTLLVFYRGESTEATAKPLSRNTEIF